MASTKVISRSRSNFLKKFLGQLNDTYLVGSLMLLGLLLRLPSLRVGLFLDEASTYFDALPSEVGEVVSTVIRSELNPPGFFLIMHQWMRWFGVEEIVLKLPALLFGLLLIAVTYGLGRVVSSRATGLVAATVTTFAPKAIYYSQEARPYTLTALLCCLLVLLYCKALKSDKQKWYLLGFVLCATLLIYVQYTGLLLVGSLAILTVYLLWCKEPSLRVVPFALAFSAVFLLFVPWLPAFLTHLHTGTPWWDKTPWWMWPKLVVGLLAYTIPLTQFFQILLILPILLTFGLGIWRLFHRVRPSSRLAIAPLSTPIITLGMSVGLVAGFQATLSYGLPGTARYMFPFAPLAWVLYSSWAVTLFHWFGRYCDRRLIHAGLRVALVSTLLCGLVLPNVIQALSFGNSPKSGLRALAADLGRWNLQQTVYVLAPDHLAASFGYYFARIHPVPFYGFARWNRPELYSPQGYAKLWQDPAAITNTMQRIQNQAQQGYCRLAFIKGITPHDQGQMPYSRTDQLLSELRRIYPLVIESDYRGLNESVTLYLFTLKLCNY